MITSHNALSRKVFINQRKNEPTYEKSQERIIMVQVVDLNSESVLTHFVQQLFLFFIVNKKLARFYAKLCLVYYNVLMYTVKQFSFFQIHHH